VSPAVQHAPLHRHFLRVRLAGHGLSVRFQFEQEDHLGQATLLCLHGIRAWRPLGSGHPCDRSELLHPVHPPSSAPSSSCRWPERGPSHLSFGSSSVKLGRPAVFTFTTRRY